MKILCYILSISLFLLGSLPCVEATGESMHADACEQEAENHAEDTDACTSLCPCACMGCHGFSLSVPLSCPFPAPTYHTTSLTSYYHSWHQDFNPPIWQPPQLSVALSFLKQVILS